MTDHRPGIAGLDTIAAFRAALQKQDFFHSPRRPKPIRPQGRSRRFRGSIDVLGKLLRRLGDSRRPYEGLAAISIAPKKLKPNLQDGQKGRSTRPRVRQGPQAYPPGYVEDLASRERSRRAFSPSCHYMTPSARSLYTSTHRSQPPYSISHPGWFSRMKSKTYGSSLVPMSSTHE